MFFRDRVTPRRYYAVDDDGDLSQFKTTVTILNQEQDQGIFIDSYSNVGFLLSSGIRVFGPCAIFPRSVLHWNVGGREVFFYQLIVILDAQISVVHQLIYECCIKSNLPRRTRLMPGGQRRSMAFLVWSVFRFSEVQRWWNGWIKVIFFKEEALQFIMESQDYHWALVPLRVP